VAICAEMSLLDMRQKSQVPQPPHSHFHIIRELSSLHFAVQSLPHYHGDTTVGKDRGHLC
jgi:hypothetical protein